MSKCMFPTLNNKTRQVKRKIKWVQVTMPNLFRSELFSKGKKFESWFSSSKIKKFGLFRSEITLEIQEFIILG